MNRVRRKALQERVDAFKSVPCMDCDQTYPSYVMDFDHVRGIKVSNIARMVTQQYSWVRIAAEIAKCDAVCSNCHRMRTHGAAG